MEAKIGESRQDKNGELDMTEDSRQDGNSDSNELLSHQHVQEIDSSTDQEYTKPSVVRRRKRRMRSSHSESSDSKIQQIQEVLSSEFMNINKLRDLAISRHGLVTDDLRRKAWPRLLNIEEVEFLTKPSLEEVQAHKEYQQVLMDVNRSLKRFPPGIDDDYRFVLMDELTVLIVRVLMRHPHLHYYQGFHDVAITFLLVLGEDMGFLLMEKLAISHFSEFMRPNMERTMYYLSYLYPILKHACEPLYEHMVQSNVGTVFCLPWLITWYAHTLSDYRHVVRLYDFFLSSPSHLMPMYVAAAIVVHRRQDVMDGEVDMAIQHSILSKVPDSLPFETILCEATELYKKYPPASLENDVNVYLRQRAAEEDRERDRTMIRRRMLQAAKYRQKYGRFFGFVLNVLPSYGVARTAIFGAMGIALAAFLTSVLYTRYSNSEITLPFLSKKLL